MPFDFKSYFNDITNKNGIYFHPNSGNAGDSLIACATFQLFEGIELSYKILDQKKFDPKGKTLIYGGGGNLVPEYNTAREFIQRYHSSVDKFILLPHTVSGHEDLLASLGSNTDIFCREEISYEYVERSAPNANVYLADDMAFSLNPDKILKNYYGFINCLSNKSLSMKRTLKIHLILTTALMKRLTESRKQHTLNCFRKDSEGIMKDIPKGNIDISKKFKYGTATPIKAFFATYMVFRFMNSYETINTDRLHLAIAGGLLGKHVNFYPNSYYKCEAVYNFSMRDRYPNINWMG